MALRLADLVVDHRPPGAMVGVSGGPLGELADLAGLPADAVVPAEALNGGSEPVLLVLVQAGELTAASGEGLERDLSRMSTGSAALFLLRDAVEDISWPSLVSSAVRRGCQVVDVAPLSGMPAHRSAVIVRRDAALRPPLAYLAARPAGHVVVEDQLRLGLRFAGELAFVSVQERALRARAERLAMEVDELRRRVRAAEISLAEQRERERAAVSALKSSRSYRTGRALAGVRRPAGLLRLPVRLARALRRQAPARE